MTGSTAYGVLLLYRALYCFVRCYVGKVPFISKFENWCMKPLQLMDYLYLVLCKMLLPVFNTVPWFVTPTCALWLPEIDKSQLSALCVQRSPATLPPHVHCSFKHTTPAGYCVTKKVSQ